MQEKEFLKWKKKDPLKLIEDKIFDKDLINRIKNTINLEVIDAFEFAENSPYPETFEAHEGVYAE